MQDRYAPEQWMYYLTNVTYTYNPSTTPWGFVIINMIVISTNYFVYKLEPLMPGWERVNLTEEPKPIKSTLEEY